MTVKNNVIAVSKDTLDLAVGVREPGSDLPQAFHAVFDQRIVLKIGGPSVKPEGIFDPAVDHSFVEGDGDVFVGLGHRLSPRSETSCWHWWRYKSIYTYSARKTWDRARECQGVMHWIDKSCCQRR